MTDDFGTFKRRQTPEWRQAFKDAKVKMSQVRVEPSRDDKYRAEAVGVDHEGNQLIMSSVAAGRESARLSAEESFQLAYADKVVAEG